MLRRRWIVLILVWLTVGSTLGTSLAWGVYRRSPLFTREVSAFLTEFFNLPAEIQRSLPLTLHGGRFFDIRVWLPEKRGLIFHGQQAEWRPAAENPAGGGHYLRLIGGAFTIDTALWQRDDYRRVLESGLGHNFAELELERVEIQDVDFKWRRDDLLLQTRRASGLLHFKRDGTGLADLTSRWLNDCEVADPITINARFRPAGGLTIEQVVLDVPAIPLTALSLESALGTSITSGSFRGEVMYSETAGEPVFGMSGFVENVRLEEVSALLPAGPIRGRLDMQIDQGRVEGRALRELVFRGRLEDVDVATVAEQFGLAGLTGRAALTIHEGKIRDNDVAWLALSGRAGGVPLDSLAALFGRAEITGSLNVDIKSLLVREGRLDSAEILVTASPPDGAAGYISRELIAQIVQQLTGVSLATVLPERVEYARFGARLLIDGDSLRVLGSHGARNTTILTVRVFGRELGVLFQPARTFDIGPILQRLRRDAEQTDIEDFQRWLRTHPPGPPRPI